MLIFYAPTTGGFYNSIDHANEIPKDAVEISEHAYSALFAAPFLNRCITSDDMGYPVLSELEVDRIETQILNETHWRDAQLTATDRLVARDRDEMDDGGGTTLDQAQYTQLQAYRRALRDWPQDELFPAAEHRPVAPPWLKAQLQ
ncbi:MULTISPECIES: phage tail assembly chaperone [unclassified Pseudomonas]|uniref:phage tail assembly chaperone n=1 Tax=unclassified Pseudomonas TaxID=196821 RepID=UPI000921D3F9|nr:MULTISPECIES: phage tail assembly chaperone [unclassified Pseudomonas]SFY27070.1 hypothetical protein SAMN03159442_05043 [Pseudomonas sp. NFACC47-1]SFY36579.1 hypothetical protein SAMN03159352_04423 [Pseudomonas sp. NFACC43]